MADEHFLDVLRDFGLSDNEARVYLSSLELGPTSVASISRSSGVQRTNVYPIIDSLKQKGLMQDVVKGLKTYYAASNPEHLRTILAAKEKKLLDVIKDFKTLYRLEGGDSVIKHFEGVSGVKVVYDELLEPLKLKDFYYAIANVGQWQSLLGESFFKEHIEKRSRRVGVTRLLFEDSKEARRRLESADAYNEEIKIIPDLSDLHTDLVVTPYKIAMFQLHEPIEAITVNNKSFITMHKRLFETLWNTVSAP